MPTTSTNTRLAGDIKRMNKKFQQGFYHLETGAKRLEEAEAEELRGEIELNYEAFISQHKDDGQNRSYKTHVTPRPGGGYTVEINGFQVVYDEFGTGIEGYNNQHRDRSKYNLNGYNTGKKIHHFADSSQDYWVFKSGGKLHVTHGVPAGQFMYDSMINMVNGIWANVNFKKIFGDVFKQGGKK